jgi:hypothetical protein
MLVCTSCTIAVNLLQIIYTWILSFVWNLGFSQLWLWSVLSSGMWCHVICYIGTNFFFIGLQKVHKTKWPRLCPSSLHVLHKLPSYPADQFALFSLMFCICTVIRLSVRINKFWHLYTFLIYCLVLSIISMSIISCSTYYTFTYRVGQGYLMDSKLVHWSQFLFLLLSLFVMIHNNVCHFMCITVSSFCLENYAIQMLTSLCMHSCSLVLKLFIEHLIM